MAALDAYGPGVAWQGALAGGLEVLFLIAAGGARRRDQGLMFALFRDLDGLLRDDGYPPSRLALADQIDRTLIQAEARERQLKPPAYRGTAGAERREGALDDRVDFICTMAPQQRLSLTDPEARSHVSARDLDVLFR